MKLCKHQKGAGTRTSLGVSYQLKDVTTPGFDGLTEVTVIEFENEKHHLRVVLTKKELSILLKKLRSDK